MADALSRPGRQGADTRVADPLALRRALGDRLLPLLVAAMAFLAALALGGAVAAQGWADRWRLGAGAALTAQVPRPDEPDLAGGHALSRVQRSLDVLRGNPAVAAARPLAAAELDSLLEPWLGAGEAGLTRALLPAVIAVQAAPVDGAVARLDTLATELQVAVPGATLERHAVWLARLAGLLDALQACAWGALLVVATVAVLVIVAAIRAGLIARRTTLDILHGLGATDGYIAARFAGRTTGLAALGGLTGALAAIPVLVHLEHLARPVAGTIGLTAWEAATGLPASLSIGLAVLPVASAAIGYATAHGTVRLWLRALP